MDLPHRLGSVRDYAELLGRVHAFHAACEPALAPFVRSGPSALRNGPEQRRLRLRLDLADLGVPEPGSEHDVHPPELSSDDHRLGAWYVIEGSALGGLVIASEVRRRLPDAAGATRYFAGEGRRSTARWSEFQALLAQWDQRGEAACARVLAGALGTFACFTQLLEPAS